MKNVKIKKYIIIFLLTTLIPACIHNSDNISNPDKDFNIRFTNLANTPNESIVVISKNMNVINKIKLRNEHLLLIKTYTHNNEEILKSTYFLNKNNNTEEINHDIYINGIMAIQFSIGFVNGEKKRENFICHNPAELCNTKIALLHCKKYDKFIGIVVPHRTEKNFYETKMCFIVKDNWELEPMSEEEILEENKFPLPL